MTTCSQKSIVSLLDYQRCSYKKSKQGPWLAKVCVFKDPGSFILESLSVIKYVFPVLGFYLELSPSMSLAFLGDTLASKR